MVVEHDAPVRDIPTTESSSVNNEKASHPEYTENVALEGGDHWDDARTKRLIRKIDRRLLPFLALLYLLSFLDRTNIGNAKLELLVQDLKLTGLKYNNALGIFFPFYVLAEVPSNMAMKRFRPSIWIPSIMIAWGICCTLMGVVKDYNGLMAVRSCLGLAEGGLFPGITY